MRQPIKDTMLACMEYLSRIVQTQKMMKKGAKASKDGW